MQEFAVTITPRMYETDAMGHINNVSIAAWFEVVRVRFLESFASEHPPTDKSWILASTHIDFVGETFYGEDVIAKIVEVKVGNSSITFEVSMEQGGRQTIRGQAVLVHIDYDAKQPVRVPDEIREALAAR